MESTYPGDAGISEKIGARRIGGIIFLGPVLIRYGITSLIMKKMVEQELPLVQEVVVEKKYSVTQLFK